jgi:hypothetical protein
MADTFPEMIGKIIHNCGVLEFFTNNITRALCDEVTFEKALKTGFKRRLSILERLLREENKLSPEMAALIKEMKKLADDRNVIAHNPIASDDPEGKNSYILLFRRTSSFPPAMEKRDLAWLENVAMRSREAVSTFNRLLPGARQLESFKR